MSVSSALPPFARRTADHETRGSLRTRARTYFTEDSTRSVQTALGLLWLVDGALQFQPFMYSKGFPHMLTALASGQPGWLAASIKLAAAVAQANLPIFNTLFAVTQVLIGLGLLCRRTVKPALAGSFVWAMVVWCFGEGFGMLLANTASPLTGAPGAVLLYAIVGLLVWPGARPGGLVGIRAAKATWAVLWLGMAWLWLLGANSSADAVSDAIRTAPSGAGWLASAQNTAAEIAQGNGLVIAVTLSLLSAAIGVAVATDRRPRQFLAVAIALNVAYWVFGEGFGGILTGSATDPNAAPLFILLAAALYPLVMPRSVAQLSAWTRRTHQLDLWLRQRRPASVANVAAAMALTIAVPFALAGVLRMSFARVPAFGSTTLDAAQAMPSGHKWLYAVIVAQLGWAALCAIQVGRRQLSLGVLCGIGLLLTAGLTVCAGILAAHLIEPDSLWRYEGMPAGLVNEPGVWFAMVSFIALGAGQLAAGAYAVLAQWRRSLDLPVTGTAASSVPR